MIPPLLPPMLDVVLIMLCFTSLTQSSASWAPTQIKMRVTSALSRHQVQAIGGMIFLGNSKAFFKVAVAQYMLMMADLMRCCKCKYTCAGPPFGRLFLLALEMIAIP